jgi:hypothetical protein
MAIPADLSSIVLAVGGLGTAAFGLVDATKIGSNGGISNAGFAYIEDAIKKFVPDATRSNSAVDAGPGQDLLDVLHGNWINGKPLADQKAIAKSLLKLRLAPGTASTFAKATGVDANVLASVATSMTTGSSLTSEQTNVLGRFDLALTALLDRGYQHADQRYRNAAKVLGMIFALVLAVLGGWAISGNSAAYLGSMGMWQAILAGLLATPLAPISKDVASALAAGVKAVQAVKG